MGVHMHVCSRRRGEFKTEKGNRGGEREEEREREDGKWKRNREMVI